MSEKLEEQLAGIIEKAVSMAEKTGDFVMEQAPDLIREFILLHTWMHGIFLTFGVLGLFITYRIVRYMKKAIDWDEWEDYPHVVVPGAFATLFVSAFSVAAILGNILSLIKIIVAPKIYLIEYFIK